MNFCSYTNKQTTNPVVCTKNGFIYDKDAYLNLVAELGRCPVTKVDLSASDYVILAQTEKRIKTDKIDSFLKIIETEYSSILLENAELEAEINKYHKELVDTLVTQDSANKVINRLLIEKKELHKKIEENNVDLKTFRKTEADKIKSEEEFDHCGIHSSLAKAIKKQSTTLSSQRKTAKPTIDKNLISSLSVSKEIQINQKRASLQKVSIMNGLLVTGTDDCRALIFNEEDLSFLNEISAHKKRINSIELSCKDSEILVFQSSNDKTTSITALREEIELLSTFFVHTAETTANQPHPMAPYCLSASLDGYWAFLNYERNICLTKRSAGSPLLTAAIHPDGGIFATGALNGVAKIWDLSTEKEVISFDPLGSGVKSISFSNNGFYFGVCGGNEIKFFDLRKQKEVKRIEMDEDCVLESLRFDKTGLLFGFAGNNGLGVGTVKTWENIYESNKHEGVTSDLSFGDESTNLFSIGYDKKIIKYA